MLDPQAKHFDNPFGNTKFLINNYTASSFGISPLTKAQVKEVRTRGAQAKDYDGLLRAFTSPGGAAVEEEEEVAGNDVGGVESTTDEVLKDVKAGMERRKKERTRGVWALGGEEEKKEHPGEVVPGTEGKVVVEDS